jgi:hypothetical protein
MPPGPGPIPSFKPRWKEAEVERQNEMREHGCRGFWHGYIECHPEPFGLGAFLDVAPCCSDCDYWRLLAQLRTMIDQPSRVAAIARWAAILRAPDRVGSTS